MSEGRDCFVYADLMTPEATVLDCARRLVVADAYARFRRQRGDAVLFAPAIGGSGEEVEAEAGRRGISPGDLVDGFVERLREVCDAFAVSCDWERSVVTSRPELRRRTQRIFLELLEAGLVYRREPAGDDTAERPWLFRRAAFAEVCDRALDQLPGWSEEAIEAQLETLARVEGVEVDVALFGGAQLPAFTPYPDAIDGTAFVAISPNHPAVEMARTAMQAAVPGVEGLVPVVVTPTVDARFGPSVCLGIPDRDDTDREIAAKLVKAPPIAFRTAAATSKPRPAVRFRLSDQPISRTGGWGVPVPVEGGDSQVIDDRFDRMWAWLAIPVPPAEREQASLSHPALERWLPVSRAVWSGPDGERFLDERVAAAAAIQLGALPEPDPPELFAAATLCGALDGGGQDEVDGLEKLRALAGDAGPDTVRLAILHAAAVSTATTWSAASLLHAQRFLADLREFAEPRLSAREALLRTEIDRSTRLRRRLAAWCTVAEAKVSASLEQLQMHRATYDLMLFLKRIRDFEQRCMDVGELDRLDQDAVVVSLLRLVRLAAPLIPHLADELGDETALATSSSASAPA